MCSFVIRTCRFMRPPRPLEPVDFITFSGSSYKEIGLFYSVVLRLRAPSGDGFFSLHFMCLMHMHLLLSVGIDARGLGLNPAVNFTTLQAVANGWGWKPSVKLQQYDLLFPFRKIVMNLYLNCSVYARWKTAFSILHFLRRWFLWDWSWLLSTS